MAGNRRRHQFSVVQRRDMKTKPRYLAGIVGGICCCLLILLICYLVGDISSVYNIDKAQTTSESSPNDNSAFGRLISTKEIEQGTVATYSSEKGLQDTARALLQNYQQTNECVLVRSGYLDLFGKTWSCTVSFGNAVEVCFVTEDTNGQKCEVKVLRMEESQWEEVYGGIQGLSIAE